MKPTNIRITRNNIIMFMQYRKRDLSYLILGVICKYSVRNNCKNLIKCEK
jgi:hypothetical protein